MNSVPIESFGVGEHLSTSLPGDLENKVLRQAVQENLVNFPSQVPVFMKQARPDLQQKLVLLYFVHGWTMDDIANRYSLGRQRIVRILTAWRTSAVKEGYIQAIEPAHPLFQRVRLEEPGQSSEMPVRAKAVVVRISKRGAPVHREEVSEPQAALPCPIKLTGLSPAEQLETVVGVLNNQLLLCCKPLHGSIDSCRPLLARAETLCALLEAQVSATRTNEEAQATAVILAAKELFRRFQERAVTHSGPSPGNKEFERSDFVPPTRRRARHAAMSA
jgi:hypothetical protein